MTFRVNIRRNATETTVVADEISIVLNSGAEIVVLPSTSPSEPSDLILMLPSEFESATAHRFVVLPGAANVIGIAVQRSPEGTSARIDP
ncbi:hypothetical protein ACIQLK_13935 [Microbacterium sp. NPDC091382]|uniref:hypothetical protein n=1 Tax=Microbacterium sp. NPDC091382 TaxID=3364210 RepID=UPI0037F9FEB8